MILKKLKGSIKTLPNHFDIDELFDRLLPRLESLENERIALTEKLSRLKKIGIGLAIVITVGSAFFVGFFFGILVGGALGITFYTIQYHNTIREYRNNYKTKIFQELIEELGSTYKYTLDGKIDEEQIRDSGIFHEFNKVKCEDLIEGNFDEYSFKMAETNLWYAKQNSNNTDRGSTVSYIFKGLFFLGKIQQTFPTPIWILAKEHPNVHPVNRVKDGWQKVHIMNSNFRKKYDVYAKDKEKAAEILQDNILNIIIETDSKVVDTNMRLELSFQENNIYLSISTTKELFEPPIETSITDKEMFRANFKYLINTTRLLQHLTLVNPKS